jgi:3-methylfumaryl-CoA hydratase
MNSPTAPTPDLDMMALRSWIGRTEIARDLATERLIGCLLATFESPMNFPSSGAQAPLTLHWCLAPPIAAMSDLGPDGHPARGGFLPPIPLPRRMWAGGELEILDRIVAGDAIERSARIAAIDLKQGRSGALCFVGVDHTIATPRGIAVRERQNIDYRPAEAAQATSPKAPAPAADHSLKLHADPVLLFRYSALTFNGHRIHYDRPYAMGEEHYPGLVVHGPLQAALLVEFAAELAKGKPPRRFSFRGIRPLFDRADFFLKARRGGEELELWVENDDGEATMEAKASW